MATVSDPTASDELLSADEVMMPFSDVTKYIILSVSVSLLLLALGILTTQIIRYCTRVRYNQQNSSNCNQLYSEEKSGPVGSYAESPKSKEDFSHCGASGRSRCLSQDSNTSSGSSQVDREVHGSLRYSLYYDQQQSSLVVTVLQVEGLLANRQTQSPKPFVRLRLMRVVSEEEGFRDGEGDGMLWTVLHEWQTRTVKGSCNPLFGEQFSCILMEKDKLHHLNLRMEVGDFDKFSRHIVLGEVRVPLGQLNISYPLELEEDLQLPQKDLVGEVLLSLKCLPTSQRLEVGLLKVRTVLAQVCPNAALYAKINVQCNQSKLRYQKTSAVSRSTLTVFNEVLVFSLPEFPVERCKILVLVYETRTGGKSAKRLIGQLSVGKEKSFEDKHWTSMMLSVRQPVAKWHGLLL
ncbi:synaptotagmin-2 [Gouania willdenowi]|uniref:Synaptotagmin-2-like n=1 Tax=Gouania willdenowi TaxID=441366 RepID=A0A8C5GAF8_GOUWI|nr:synaptotagmin-2-like [Gouania willdenowi]